MKLEAVCQYVGGQYNSITEKLSEIFKVLQNCVNYKSIFSIVTFQFQNSFYILNNLNVLLDQLNKLIEYCILTTGWERLIRSHSSARFCFELSGNSN